MLNQYHVIALKWKADRKKPLSIHTPHRSLTLLHYFYVLHQLNQYQNAFCHAITNPFCFTKPHILHFLGETNKKTDEMGIVDNNRVDEMDTKFKFFEKFLSFQAK